jgi:hypothetical protein
MTKTRFWRWSERFPSGGPGRAKPVVKIPAARRDARSSPSGNVSFIEFHMGVLSHVLPLEQYPVRGERFKVPQGSFGADFQGRAILCMTVGWAHCLRRVWIAPEPLLSRDLCLAGLRSRIANVLVRWVRAISRRLTRISAGISKARGSAGVWGQSPHQEIGWCRDPEPGLTPGSDRWLLQGIELLFALDEEVCRDFKQPAAARGFGGSAPIQNSKDSVNLSDQIYFGSGMAQCSFTGSAQVSFRLLILEISVSRTRCFSPLVPSPPLSAIMISLFQAVVLAGSQSACVWEQVSCLRLVCESTVIASACRGGSSVRCFSLLFGMQAVSDPRLLYVIHLYFCILLLIFFRIQTWC